MTLAISDLRSYVPICHKSRYFLVCSRNHIPLSNGCLLSVGYIYPTDSIANDNCSHNFSPIQSFLTEPTIFIYQEPPEHPNYPRMGNFFLVQVYGHFLILSPFCRLRQYFFLGSLLL